MICSVCHENYDCLSQNWHYSGQGNDGEGLYIVKSKVFTTEILKQVLEHALNNGINEISVDAFLAEYEPCEGCQLLNLRQRKERDELLNSPKYQHMIYYDSF